jgi:hypothetical protein
MRLYSAIFACVAFSPVVALAEPCPLPLEFSAKYEVSRNDRTIGEAHFKVEPIGEHRYRYTAISSGTRGMASLLGATIEETAVFEVGDDTTPWLPESFRYEREIAISRRRESLQFDWQEGIVTGLDRHNDEWQASIEPGVLDPLLVNLAVIRDLCLGASGSLAYAVAEHGGVEEERYRIGSVERQHVTAGIFRALQVEREHASDRETISWHAPVLAYLPIRMRHIDDDEILEMQLVTLPEMNVPIPVARETDG